MSKILALTHTFFSVLFPSCAWLLELYGVATQVTQHQDDLNSQVVDLLIRRPSPVGGSRAQLLDFQLLTIYSTKKRGKRATFKNFTQPEIQFAP